jgi:dTDP-4-dehydrorhamnose reductase
VFDEAGLAVELTPTDTASYGAPAPRPPFSVLDNLLTGLIGLEPLPEWQFSLKRLVSELGDG